MQIWAEQLSRILESLGDADKVMLNRGVKERVFPVQEIRRPNYFGSGIDIEASLTIRNVTAKIIPGPRGFAWVLDI